MAAYRKRKRSLRPANVGYSTRRFISFIIDLSGVVLLIPAATIRCVRRESGQSERCDGPIYFCMQNSHYFVQSRRFRGPIMHASSIGIDLTSVFTLLTAAVNRGSCAHHGCR